MHGVCHGHSHGPQMQNPDNINVRAASAHVLGDLIQSIGVLLAAVIIKVSPDNFLFQERINVSQMLMSLQMSAFRNVAETRCLKML